MMGVIEVGSWTAGFLFAVPISCLLSTDSIHISATRVSVHKVQTLQLFIVTHTHTHNELTINFDIRVLEAI